MAQRVKDPVLAWVQFLAQELPHATGAAKKKTKKKKEGKKEKNLS